MNYAIIENDSLSLRRIKRACENLRPEWNLAFTSGSVEESVYLIESNRDLDLLICDIELEDGTVFKVFRSVNVSCPVIFVTAYDEYAIDAFSLFSIDYILKPLEISKLEKALVKLEGIEKRSKVLALEMISDIDKAISRNKFLKRILISIGDRFESIDISDILLFYNEDKHIFACTRKGDARITSFKSLNDIEGMLDPEVFFRASRDAIVTIESIDKVYRGFKGKLKIKISCPNFKQEIYVSAAKRNDFLIWMGHIPS